MYNEIATLYHLIYRDWNAVIAQQAAVLDAIMREHVGPSPRSILDVSCGIGTQALGLAALGHAVTASDLSSAAVERARLEAAQRNLAIDFKVADMRRCAEVHGSGFDVVLSADNSIPHLLGDDRYFVVQTRDWDGDFYDVAMYFIREGRGSRPATVIAGSSRYYAVPIDRLVSLLEESSFIEIQGLDGVLYQNQPVLLARRVNGRGDR